MLFGLACCTDLDVDRGSPPRKGEVDVQRRVGADVPTGRVKAHRRVDDG
jgi:hypothetical protein